MDRKIEKKKWPLGRVVVIFGGAGFILVLAYMVMNQSGKTRLKVDDPSRLLVSRVEYGEFQEYYPSSGWVEPETSVYLDVEGGGRVDEIYVEGGQYVDKGDLILKFSNVDLQRSNISAETQLLENLDRQRNTQFNRTTNLLILRDQLLDREYQILDLEKRYNRYKSLIEEDKRSITQEQFEEVRDQLAYQKDKRDLLKERIRVEEELGQRQLKQADQSIDRLNVALGLLEKIAESMDVRAPISGHLSSINAEIGQNINRGQRLGQIDILDKFKVRGEIDQYYLSRVRVGTEGKFELDNVDYEVAVEKVYPEVKDDSTFEFDMAFVGAPPPELRRGQQLTVELSFSEPSKSLMVAKGGFYQQTSGRWVYLVSDDGRSAHRLDIRLGRQNPRFVEILEGLKEGDWIITSGYDSFNEADELIFSEPINLGS